MGEGGGDTPSRAPRSQPNDEHVRERNRLAQQRFRQKRRSEVAAQQAALDAGMQQYEELLVQNRELEHQGGLLRKVCPVCIVMSARTFVLHQPANELASPLKPTSARYLRCATPFLSRCKWVLGPIVHASLHPEFPLTCKLWSRATVNPTASSSSLSSLTSPPCPRFQVAWNSLLSSQVRA